MAALALSNEMHTFVSLQVDCSAGV